MTSPQLLTETDAAAHLGLSPKTLSRWRWKGEGPTYLKLGSAVRYAEQDLNDFISSSKVSS